MYKFKKKISFLMKDYEKKDDLILFDDEIMRKELKI